MVISYVTFKILFVRDRDQKLKKFDLNGHPLGTLWLGMPKKRSRAVLEYVVRLSYLIYRRPLKRVENLS